MSLSAARTATALFPDPLFVAMDPPRREAPRRAELTQCCNHLPGLWNERVNAPPGSDPISMPAHGETTRNMDRSEFPGNLILLIVGGNDTTRNSITGGVRAQRESRRIRHAAQRPGGKHIRKGGKIAMWCVRGNRDSEAIENAHSFIIDRARRHPSFGIHRCVGNRPAEIQLRIVREEIMKRSSFVEVTDAPERVLSAFVKGYVRLPVRLHPRH